VNAPTVPMRVQAQLPLRFLLYSRAMQGAPER